MNQEQSNERVMLIDALMMMCVEYYKLYPDSTILYSKNSTGQAALNTLFMAGVARTHDNIHYELIWENNDAR